MHSRQGRKNTSEELVKQISASKTTSLRLDNCDMAKRSEDELIALVNAMKDSLVEVNLEVNGFFNKLSNLIMINKKMGEKLPKLVSLNLGYNALASYDGDGKDKVQNDLKGIFMTMPKVKFLDLSTNCLGKCPKLDEYLSFLPTVEAMNLSDNGLCTIKKIVESVSPTVTYIDLSENSFNKLSCEILLDEINRMQPARSALKIHFGELKEQECISRALAKKGISVSADNYQTYLAQRTAEVSAVPQAFFGASARPTEEVKTRLEDQDRTTNQI